MKSSSHHALGKFLIASYLQEYPISYRKAFSIGCVQPDKNPITYLKGSIHFQWLRGHNWENSQKYIQKVASRLQQRKRLNTLGFYQLGKLIHYTADAFTYTHNHHYTENLAAHRNYERTLHIDLESYLSCLNKEYAMTEDPSCSVSSFIRQNHNKYMHNFPSIENDMEYCVRMCAQVLQLLLQRKSMLTA